MNIIQSIFAKFGSTAEKQKEVFDVVCGMKFPLSNNSLSAAFEGGTQYFCSAQCKDAFRKDPKKYVKS